MYAIDRAAGTRRCVRRCRRGSNDSGERGGATPRQVADRYVAALCELDPLVATSLGHSLADRLPGHRSRRGSRRARSWPAARSPELAAAPADDAGARRCARLLRERLGADLALHEAGEGLRELSNLFSPVHAIRQVFMLMPAGTEEDWSLLARRMAAVPAAYRGFVTTLREGAARGLLVAPRQVTTVVGQLDAWLAGPWFGTFAAARPGRRCAATWTPRRRPPTPPWPRSATSCATSTSRGAQGRRTPSAGALRPGRPPLDRRRPGRRRPDRARPTPSAGTSTAGCWPSSGGRPTRCWTGRAPREAMRWVERQRPRGRRRRGHPRPPAGRHGPGDRRARRRPLRHRRADPPGRGGGRRRRAARPARSTRSRRRTSRGRGGPGCRCSAATASRCGT